MSGWIIKKHIPYEGICEYYCSSEKEVLDYLSHQSGLDMDNIEVESAPARSYMSWEFIQVFGKEE